MSAAATMVCFQATTRQANQALEELGLPNTTSVDLANLPTSAEDFLSAATTSSYNCCDAQGGIFIGPQPANACRARGSGFYPDVPEFIVEVEACRAGGGSAAGAWSVDDFEPNIENGGMEVWRDEHRPEGFSSFGVPAAALMGVPRPPGMDMQVAFRDSDAHTGRYSLRLKNFDVSSALPPEVRSYASAAVGSVVTPAGVQTCTEPCASEAAGQVANSFSAAVSQIASLAAAPIKSHVCGAYKGYIASSDQLRIDLSVRTGDRSVGNAKSIFTRSTGDWIEFVMPMSAIRAALPQQGAFGISARIEPRQSGDGGMRQAMASMNQWKMSPLTEVKLDSVHFCDPMGMTAFHPLALTADKLLAVPEAEEDTLGVQAFVNRDNDDSDGEFDFADSRVDGEDDLAQVRLYLPLNSFGKVRFESPPELGSAYALWASADKSTAFDQANQTLEVLELLRTTPDGLRYERDIWIEILKPSTKARDLRFEFVFENKLNPDQVMRDAVLVTGLEISEIRFEGNSNSLNDDSELDDEPNYPSPDGLRNLRVFPGKRWDAAANAPEDKARDRVDVVARLNVPPVRPVPAFFRSFDVDDPSASNDEVDNESTAQDNRGNPLLRDGFFPKGADGMQRVSFEQQEVRFEFQVTRQPGDNFRIAGAGDSDHLMTLENDDVRLAELGADMAGIYDRDVLRATNKPAEASLPDGAMSDMLTVWRKLHLEIDTMRPVRDNALEGFITDVQAVSSDRDGWRQYQVTIDKNIFDSLPADAKTDNVGIENAYKRGVMTINNQRVAVDYSSANYFADDVITLAFLDRGNSLETLIGADPEGLPFRLEDNDKYKNGDELDPVPLDRLRPAFAPAYVLPAERSLPHNPISRVPFLLNYQYDDQEYLRSIYEFDNEAYHEDPGFWLVYLLGAFQGMTAEDGDGGAASLFGWGSFVWENVISGQADSLPGGVSGRGAVVFMESGRELESGNQETKDGVTRSVPGWRLVDTAPHEIGHLFGGSHTDGGLMDERAALKSENFSPVSLDKIRGHSYP
ncbi:MAG: hypothetical protein Cons2KO_29470 [Congregibacter sp.]